MSKKISQLPPFIGTLPADAKIPVSIGSTTYRTTPADMASALAPTLAQTLTQGGRDLDEFISSDYTIQASDRSKFREVLTSSNDITLTLDDSTWTPSDNVAGATFIFKNSNALDVTDKVILTKNPLIIWDVCGLGGSMNEIEIPAGYIAQITYASLGFNVVLLSAKTEDKLEFQITQSGTNPPEILAGSPIGFRGATAAPDYSSTGAYFIDFDLPILAKAKDCYKGESCRQVQWFAGTASSTYGFYSWYVASNTRIFIETFNFAYGSPSQEDELLGNPVKITLEFKP